mmetsp:Transcript_782/g.1448  ORF Transcript_782/g.1448 Transcript_782/m.1448 type:complete len:291 (-) Transcript_782:297-1169(-)
MRGAAGTVLSTRRRASIHLANAKGSDVAVLGPLSGGSACFLARDRQVCDCARLHDGFGDVHEVRARPDGSGGYAHRRAGGVSRGRQDRGLHQVGDAGGRARPQLDRGGGRPRGSLGSALARARHPASSVPLLFEGPVRVAQVAVGGHGADGRAARAERRSCRHKLSRARQHARGAFGASAVGAVGRAPRFLWRSAERRQAAAALRALAAGGHVWRELPRRVDRARAAHARHLRQARLGLRRTRRQEPHLGRLARLAPPLGPAMAQAEREPVRAAMSRATAGQFATTTGGG